MSLVNGMVEKGVDLGIATQPPTPSANKFSYYRRNGLFCILDSNGIEAGFGSGVYTPVFSNLVQFSAGTVIPQGTFKYIRIGNIIKVTGKINCTTTGANTVLNSCRMTLPILPSVNFTNNYQITGIGVSKLNINSAARPMHVEAVAGTRLALLAVYSAANNTANNYNVELTYEMF